VGKNLAWYREIAATEIKHPLKNDGLVIILYDWIFDKTMEHRQEAPW
jgi:hypothetical protein